MPGRSDIETICILGAGPIVIGQACEFDYAGTQGCKALRARGYRVVLVNSNPATIMTDPDMADAVYVEPLTLEVVTRILERERPQALLPTLGGQTALNLALALHDTGVLERLGIELLGARAQAIRVAEDREAFKNLVGSLGLESPRSGIARSMEEARRLVRETGLPAVLRPSFTMGGVGAGVAYDQASFERLAHWGLRSSPVHELLVDESLLGWKEFELEVVRDGADHAIIICSIENLDPMGVHTGDSITVAPAQTLTDREYQRMRNAAIAIVRGVGVDVGGCNVQFALDPDTARMVVIEMNPRVSRSSALASKATGYPIAAIASLLAVGFTLDELPNAITRDTTACFEPTLDYVVTKIPRFAFEKFPGADTTLTTQMKSVGEVMAIGRTFSESLLKALRGLETGFRSLAPTHQVATLSDEALCAELARPHAERLLVVAEALRRGLGGDLVHAKSAIDPWFVAGIDEIVQAEATLLESPARVESLEGMRRAKRLGLSDARLAELTGRDEDAVRDLRRNLGVEVTFKRVDTCAAEFEAATPYLYSTYEEECESRPDDAPRVVILGGGPNRIGQGIEFDYLCVKAARAVRSSGRVAIMVNCNPETVSTDHDISDRLYFEPVDLEAVLAVVERERAGGVIVQLGGQTPLRLARDLVAHGVPVLGTQPDTIELAEDRERFGEFAARLGLRLPEHRTARTAREAREAADAIGGFPVVVRPSHVLGGRAMAIVRDAESLERYLELVFLPGGERAHDPRSLPLLVDRFLEGAIELDVDAVCDGQQVVIGGVLQQVEPTGVHSGDSACLLPAHTLSPAMDAAARALTRRIALELGVVGLINVQLAFTSDSPDDLYVIEVNPRGSRTVPFVSKATGVCLTTLATQVMLGATLAELGVERDLEPLAIYCKEAVLPWSRFAGVAPLLSPEMRSTGEVMAGGVTAREAFTRAQLAAGQPAPRSRRLMLDLYLPPGATAATPGPDLAALTARPELLDDWILYVPALDAPLVRSALQRPVHALEDLPAADRALGAALVLHGHDPAPDALFLWRFRSVLGEGCAYFTTLEAFALWAPFEAEQWQPRPLPAPERT